MVIVLERPVPPGVTVHSPSARAAELAVHLVASRRLHRALRDAARRGARSQVPLEVVRSVLSDRGAPHRGAWRCAVDVWMLRRLVEGLDRRAASAVLAALSDGELGGWHARLAGLAAECRDATYVAVGERVGLAQWRRFGSFTDDIDPDPSGDLRDLAREARLTADEAAALVRRWETWDGPLAVQGEGDDHEYAANDVVQGHIGNCYLVAALQAIADVAPDRLAGLCAPNANGTWTVSLPGGRRTVVSPDVVVDVHGEALFARRPDHGERELWPMLLEKAYAQLHGGWAEIVEGHTEDAVELLTGVAGHVVPASHVDIPYLARWRRAGAPMVLTTIAVPPRRDHHEWLVTDAPPAFRRPGGEFTRLHPSHAFLVREVDEDAGTVELRNPWDTDAGGVVLDPLDLRECAAWLHVTDLAGDR